MFYIHHVEDDYMPALLGVIEKQGRRTPPLFRQGHHLLQREREEKEDATALTVVLLMNGSLGANNKEVFICQGLHSLRIATF